MRRLSKIVAIQGDSLNSINRKTDTTLLLALEAQRRGYKIYYYETKNLTFLKDKIYALCKEVEFYDDSQKNIADVNAAKSQALEQGMVDAFRVYLVVDGVPQEA